MAPSTITVLLTSFPGLNLPTTCALPLPASTTITELQDHVSSRLPSKPGRLILTTSSNTQIPSYSSATISSLLSSSLDEFIPLRLSVPLCGGKGGFGSQLRAAGGRMSSKRKKNQGENNGSSRNLDGRRLRTVTEAKALAEYLAIKPDMERKEKEKRRKRWEEIIELADRKEAEMKNGSKSKLDENWIEEKDGASERTRDAVRAAMKYGTYRDNLHTTPIMLTKHESNSSTNTSDESDIMKINPSPTRPSGKSTTKDQQSQKLFGFDEDDEFMSDDEEKEEEKEDEEEDNESGQLEEVVEPKGRDRRHFDKETLSTKTVKDGKVAAKSKAVPKGRRSTRSKN